MKIHGARTALGLAAAAVAATGSLALSGCALGNKAELHLVRNISFGQEMLDLKRARDAGALTEEEYLELKRKLMELVDLEGVVDIVEDVSDRVDTDEPGHEHPDPDAPKD